MNWSLIYICIRNNMPSTLFLFSLSFFFFLFKFLLKYYINIIVNQKNNDRKNFGTLNFFLALKILLSFNPLTFGFFNYFFIFLFKCVLFYIFTIYLVVLIFLWIELIMYSIWMFFFTTFNLTYLIIINYKIKSILNKLILKYNNNNNISINIQVIL